MPAPRVVQAALLGIALAVPLAAQADAPLLRVMTRQPDRIAPFAQLFDLVAPAAADGSCYELTVPADGPAAVRQVPATAATPALLVEVRPAAWAARAQNQLAAFERQLAARTEAIAQLAGMRPGQGAELGAGAVGLLASLAAGRLVVTDAGAPHAYDIDLQLTAVPGTALAAWLAAARPAAEPAPRLPWPDAMMRLQVRLSAPSLAAVCEPFLGFAAGFGSANAAQHAAAEAELRALLPTLDGSLGLVLGAGRLGMVYGLRDADAFVARATSPARLAQQLADLQRQHVDAEFTPAAITHRGVEALRSRVRGTQPLPWLGNGAGELVSFGARVGDLWVQVGGGETPQQWLQSAIDDALDRGLRTASAATAERQAAWLSGEVDLARLRQTLSRDAADAAAPAAEGAARVAWSVSSADHSLRARFQVR